MGEIWLIRHGETAWSLAGRHTGTTDVPLTPHGVRQAERLGRRIAGKRFALVLTSPLARARETCLLAGLAAGAEADADLAEWDYGDLEGRTSAEIRTGTPGWTIWTGAVPGGETAAQVGARADRAIGRAQGADGDVALFAHGHLLRVLAARWLGLAPAAGRYFALDTASVSVLGVEQDLPVIRSWNERCGGESGA
ncbi:MAG: histidine phosphatase family protein [Acidobacteria bacterium 21-70-11]|nr:MAG: histidine phosphatase family protein [Acidobacteria bacterium 21-70-11]HQT94131.1 histidine phosphatase family protein [Thermoanaerobaculaceae bacterium]HQU33414.1 histidine phosphatase family protein [Thermoanaerobaculaceae bacterium]